MAVFMCSLFNSNERKTRTSKVGAISKAQKAQNIFGKKLEFFSFEKRRIVPKNVKGGTLLDLLTYILLQNIEKLEGGPLGTSGFVGFLEKVKQAGNGPSRRHI